MGSANKKEKQPQEEKKAKASPVPSVASTTPQKASPAEVQSKKSAVESNSKKMESKKNDGEGGVPPRRISQRCCATCSVSPSSPNPSDISLPAGSLSALPTDVISLFLVSFSPLHDVLSIRRSCRKLRLLVDTQVAEEYMEEFVRYCHNISHAEQLKQDEPVDHPTYNVIFRIPFSFSTARSFIFFTRMTLKRRYLLERVFFANMFSKKKENAFLNTENSMFLYELITSKDNEEEEEEDRKSGGPSAEDSIADLSFPSIIHLSVGKYNCEKIGWAPNPDGLAWLLQRCPNLEELNLQGCADLILPALSGKRKRLTITHQLKVLNLSKSEGLDDGIMLQFVEEALISSPTAFKQLKEISCCFTGVGNQTLNAFMKLCSPEILTSVDLWYCKSMTKVPVLNFLHCFPNMKNVRLPQYISDLNCPSGWREVADLLPKLEEMKVDPSLGDRGTTLSPFTKTLNLKFITSFELSYNYYTDFSEMLSLMPKLKKLILNSHHCNTDPVVASLIKNCPDILHLTMNFCDWVDDAALKSIASTYPNLQIFRCFKAPITDDGVMALVSSCRQLKKLHLSEAPHITDKSLNCIMENLSELHTLSLYECFNVHNISGLVRCCTKLRSLDCHLQHLSQEFLDEIASAAANGHPWSLWQLRAYSESKSQGFAMTEYLQLAKRLPLLSSYHMPVSFSSMTRDDELDALLRRPGGLLTDVPLPDIEPYCEELGIPWK